MKKTSILKLIIVLIIVLIIILFISLFKKEKTKESNDEQIQKKIEYGQKNHYECNEFLRVSMTEERLVSIYFNDYKLYVNKKPEEAYEMLDKEYRERRFESFEEFKKFIETYKERFSNTNLAGYKTSFDKDEKRVYTCVDQYDTNYVFTENAIMDYTVKLDTYTIDTAESIENYNNSTDQQKVAINIDKFMQAINNADYNYAYSCLADSFKNNYFKTQADFENYAKDTFYISSKVGYNEFDTQGNLFTYSVILFNNRINDDTMTKTFIVQLGDGLDFKLSFNV